MPTNTVGESCCNCGNAGKCDKEKAIEHCHLDTNIGNLAGSGAEVFTLSRRLTIESNKHRTRDIEALSHRARHFSIGIEGISG